MMLPTVNPTTMGMKIPDSNQLENFIPDTKRLRMNPVTNPPTNHHIVAVVRLAKRSVFKKIVKRANMLDGDPAGLNSCVKVCISIGDARTETKETATADVIIALTKNHPRPFTIPGILTFTTSRN